MTDIKTLDDWKSRFMQATDDLARLAVMITQTRLVDAQTALTVAVHNDPELAATMVRGLRMKVERNPGRGKFHKLSWWPALNELYTTSYQFFPKAGDKQDGDE